MNAAYLALAAAAMFIGYLVERKIRRGRLRRIVFEQLDNAFANGHFEPANNASPDEIAYDMTCYSPEFDENGTRPETLTPYVREWLHQKGL